MNSIQLKGLEELLFFRKELKSKEIFVVFNTFMNLKKWCLHALAFHKHTIFCDKKNQGYKTKHVFLKINTKGKISPVLFLNKHLLTISSSPYHQFPNPLLSFLTANLKGRIFALYFTQQCTVH